MTKHPVRVLGAVMGTAAALASASPWTADHEGAVVRLQVPLQGGTRPQVATGFIVSGEEKRHYVVTASHVIVQTVAPPPSEQCMPLPTGLRMTLRETSGPEVIGKCVIHIGSDVALIELQAPAGAATYPRLQLNARDPKRHEVLYFGGFPFEIAKVLDRKAEVSTVDGPEGMVMTDSNSAPGMSGGPYLEAKGTVVGLHHGQEDRTAGWGLFVPISLLRTTLEKYVRPVEVGPDPGTPAAQQPPSCSGASVGKAFRHVAPSHRATIYSNLCVPADPEVVELLEKLPYEPDPSLLVAAVAAPPNFNLPSITPVALPAPPSEKREVERVKKELALSTKTCLNETRVTVSQGLLNCDNEGQFVPTPNRGGANDPSLVVLHSTYTTTAKAALAALTSSNSSASAHVLIERDGSFVQLVPFDLAAWHAGQGSWQGMTGLNSKSIGIELVNAGQLKKGEDGKFRNFAGQVVPDHEVQVIDGRGWHRYTTEQIAATVAIVKALAKTYKIDAVVGHCDIDPQRKLDPGPAFPTGQIEGYALNIPDRRGSCPNA